MAWKKRKRYPIPTLPFLCGACGFIFIVGNVLLVHSGFLLPRYENTAKDTKDRWTSKFLSGLGGETLVRSWSSEHLPPDNIVAVEPRLRKLMENRRDSLPLHKNSGSKKRTNVYVSTNDLKSTLVHTSSCDEMYNITDLNYLASGWTKSVYRGKLKGENVAIKMVDINGHDMTACTSQYGLGTSQCYLKASQKILKEILILEGLSHPNIIKVRGHCVPSKPYDGTQTTVVSMATELGDTIGIIKLLQMSWEDRLRVSYGVAKLIHYLANSPYGSLAMNDFRRQQFVLVDGEIKLTDVDDLSFEEPRCKVDSDCAVHFSSANFTITTKCQFGRCHGHNEKRNIFNTARHFTTFLLPHGAPRSLKPYVDPVINGFSNVTMNTEELLGLLKNVLDLYTSGAYLQRTEQQSRTEYRVYNQSDLPGLFDYRCRFSLASGGCTVSVFDQREAEDICNSDQECKAFVMSSQKTWSGRTIVHLKSNIAKHSVNPKTVLCVKPGVI